MCLFRIEFPTERRVKRWAFGFYDLMSDPRGRMEFEQFLQKEYSQENIRFWKACEQMKITSLSKVPHLADKIYKWAYIFVPLPPLCKALWGGDLQLSLYLSTPDNLQKTLRGHGLQVWSTGELTYWYTWSQAPLQAMDYRWTSIYILANILQKTFPGLWSTSELTPYYILEHLTSLKTTFILCIWLMSIVVFETYTYNLCMNCMCSCFREFLAAGAPCEVNIDCRTMDKVLENLKKPSR